MGERLAGLIGTAHHPLWTRDADEQKECFNMPKTTPAWSGQFKREVLAYQATVRCSITAAADHFGVSANSLGEWSRRTETPPGSSPSVGAREETEYQLARSRRENRDGQLRWEIIKKTVGIVSVPSGNTSLRLKL